MDNLYVIVSFLVKPQYKAETVNILTTFINESRLMPGCIECNLFEAVEDVGNYTLIEIWASEDAQAEHINSEHFKKFAPFIGTRVEMLKVQRLSKLY